MKTAATCKLQLQKNPGKSRTKANDSMHFFIASIDHEWRAYFMITAPTAASPAAVSSAHSHCASLDSARSATETPSLVVNGKLLAAPMGDGLGQLAASDPAEDKDARGRSGRRRSRDRSPQQHLVSPSPDSPLHRCPPSGSRNDSASSSPSGVRARRDRERASSAKKEARWRSRSPWSKKKIRLQRWLEGKKRTEVQPRERGG